MMRTITVESYAEFMQRHGGNPMHVGSRFVFADGASCAASDRDLRWEPPADPAACLRLRIAYVRKALEGEEKAFATYKQQCLDTAYLAAKYENLPPPPHDAPTRLRAGKARIEALRVQLADLEAQQTPTPADLERAKQAEMDRERRAAQQALLDEIEAIEV